jgi:hypothetical protein
MSEEIMTDNPCPYLSCKADGTYENPFNNLMLCRDHFVFELTVIANSLKENA